MISIEPIKMNRIGRANNANKSALIIINNNFINKLQGSVSLKDLTMQFNVGPITVTFTFYICYR